MKKYFILLFVGLFLLPFVSADITFSNDFYDKYNLGDSLSIDGYISGDSNTNGLFRLYINCGDNSQLLAGRMIHLNANENHYFNQNVNLLINSQGVCNFRATFNDESKESESFEIVD